MKNTIFVQIASYRDPDLKNTLQSMIDNAKYPKNLVVGICRQYHPDDTFEDVAAFEEFICDDDKRFLTCLGEDGAHHTNYGDSTMHDIYVVSTLAVQGDIKWQHKRDNERWNKV